MAVLIVDDDGDSTFFDDDGNVLFIDDDGNFTLESSLDAGGGGASGSTPKRLPRGQVYHPHGWHFVR